MYFFTINRFLIENKLIFYNNNIIKIAEKLALALNQIFKPSNKELNLFEEKIYWALINYQFKINEH